MEQRFEYSAYQHLCAALELVTSKAIYSFLCLAPALMDDTSQPARPMQYCTWRYLIAPSLPQLSILASDELLRLVTKQVPKSPSSSASWFLRLSLIKTVLQEH